MSLSGSLPRQSPSLSLIKSSRLSISQAGVVPGHFRVELGAVFKAEEVFEFFDR